MPWKIEFMPGWDRHFKNFDNSIQQQLLKKIDKMKQPLAGRGLHSCSYLVEESGQYRICFIEDERAKTKFIHFIGGHKQYEQWFRQQT